MQLNSIKVYVQLSKLDKYMQQFVCKYKYIQIPGDPYVLV